MIDRIKDKIDDFKDDPALTVAWSIVWLCGIAAVVLLIICIASACVNENNKIDRGIVTSKDHYSGHWIHTQHTMIYIPESYELTISGEKKWQRSRILF